MTAPPVLEPNPKTLQRTLVGVTETLAGELAHPTTQVPDWSVLDWKIARGVAAMHGISPLLANTLRFAAPEDFIEFLGEQRAHTAMRHARLDALLSSIGARSQVARIAMVALKGAELHARGICRAGDRPMADIDLLVRAEDAAPSGRIFEELGFIEVRRSARERVFAANEIQAAARLGEHSDNPIKIELHERIFEPLPLEVVDITNVVFPPGARPGLNPYPSPAALMAHLALHAAGSMATKTLRLLQLHDLASLASSMTASDWQEIAALGNNPAGLWWAWPPLALAHRYFPGAIPAHMAQLLESACPRYLARTSRRRRLCELSYSHPWIEPFPAIAWSRSLTEALRYSWSRIRPSTEHLALRARDARTQRWAHDSSWVSMPQSRRMLRWATSRPLRPVTASMVRAVLSAADHA